MNSENVIELKDVSFSFGKEPVLTNINLNVHRGDYVGIIGPNGSGKTTLLKIMIGLLNPDSGSVKLEVSKIGYVPQKATYFESSFPVTVWEVVMMGRYSQRGLLRRVRREDGQAVKDALEEVGMWESRDNLIHDLSGGEQQRVLIARALASSPEIIFLDEPTVGVDIGAQEKFYELLQKLNKKFGLTLVLVSHDIGVVTSEVNELVCVNRTLIYHGEPEKFIKEDYLEKVYGKGLKFVLHGH